MARDVWAPLQKQIGLRDAFVRSELKTHLKSFARLIEASASRGIDAVAKEFDVDKTSAFTTLQRKIRTAATPKQATDYNGAADRAFQVGSTAWAAKLLGKNDPTKFKLKAIVDAINDDPDRALILAVTLVLEQYGERLLRSAVPGGSTDNGDIESVLKDYRQQFRKFVQQNQDAAAWGSGTVAATLEKYVTQLIS